MDKQVAIDIKNKILRENFLRKIHEGSILLHDALDDYYMSGGSPMLRIKICTIFFRIMGTTVTRDRMFSLFKFVELVCESEMSYTLQQEYPNAAPKLLTVIYAGNHRQESCAICLDIFKKGSTLAKLECSQLFHVECISQWLKHNNTCPHCRRQVPNAETIIPYRIIDAQLKLQGVWNSARQAGIVFTAHELKTAFSYA